MGMGMAGISGNPREWLQFRELYGGTDNYTHPRPSPPLFLRLKPKRRWLANTVQQRQQQIRLSTENLVTTNDNLYLTTGTNKSAVIEYSGLSL